MGAAAEARSTRGMRGVRVDFFDPVLGKAQTLYYFSLDATDVALRKTPEFLEMLAAQRPATTFIKSASYLLHGPHFARTRDVLLDITDTFVQDDTGVPYRLLREQGWDVRLYGEYAKPVRDFGRFGYQADLEAAYRSPRKPGSLPFPFGYRGYSGVSTLLVAHSAAKAR